jgi:phosphate transport system ATP-binding protein
MDSTVTYSIENLDFYYSTSHALKNINMSVATNKVTALIGPSGCGKSTFLRCLNRMNDTITGTRVEGTILLHGNDIYADYADVVELRKQVGMVFQKPNPFPQSIWDNVAFGPNVLGTASSKTDLEEIVQTSLEKAALWDEVKDKMQRNALSLSLGQQQRLCIARVLATKPDVILMDESTSALDPIATLRIEDLIQQLKLDYTIIIVTHNMQQAARVSDFTGLFWLGELIEFAKTEQIFTNPEKELTESYITGKMG